MATLLDLTLLNYLTPLAAFLFILIICYAVLDKFKLLGDNVAPKFIAAFSIALIFMFSTRMVKVILTATPWFILLIFFGFFLIAMLMFMGVKEDEIHETVKSGTVVYIMLVISLIIFIITIVGAFQDVSSPYEGEDGQTRTNEGLRALVHPRLLGALFLLVMTTYAIMFVSQGFVKK